MKSKTWKTHFWWCPNKSINRPNLCQLKINNLFLQSIFINNKTRNTALRGKNESKLNAGGNNKNSTVKMVWTCEKDRKETTEEDIWINTKRTEEKRKMETNLENWIWLIQWENEGWRMGRKRWMRSRNKFLKWVQEVVQVMLQPNNTFSLNIWKIFRVSEY